MTIYADDIKLMQSQRMTDTDDGGGRMTGIEIVNGEHNTIFPDVSDLDRAYGVVNIRSIHAAVQSPNSDTYYGATVGLLDGPNDENVNITLMTNNNPYAVRTDTQELMERYLTASVKYQCEILGTMGAGQRTVRFIQRENLKVPKVGDVLMLDNMKLNDEQYIKIKSVTKQNQTFTSSTGDFTRDVITCEITESLKKEYIGVEASKYDPSSDDSAVYETQVTNNVKFYTVKDLDEDADFASNNVKLDGIYTQLLPSSRVETGHVAQPLSDIETVEIVSSADGNYTASAPAYLRSDSFLIDASSRGYVFVKTLEPAPPLGTTVVKFRVNGEWYELRDDDRGVFSGADVSYGSGSIDTEGNMIITLGELPDYDSYIIYQWSDLNKSTALITDIDASAKFDVLLDTYPDADSVVITWADKTATVADNVISGDATGTIRGKQVTLIPNELPPANTSFNFSWSDALFNVSTTRYIENPGSTLTFTVDSNGTSIDIAPNSISLFLDVTADDYEVTDGRENYKSEFEYIEINDDGAGNLVYRGVAVGTVNYFSRTFTINHSFNANFTKQKWKYSVFLGWFRDGVSIVNVPAHVVSNHAISSTELNTAKTLVKYSLQSADAAVPDSQIVIFDEIKVNVETGSLSVLAGSLVFSLGSDTYTTIDNDIYVDGSIVGSINNQTGVCTLTSWDAGSPIVNLLAGLLYSDSTDVAQSVAFITVGSPVLAQSLTIQGQQYGGTPISASSSSDGIISGDGITGTIDYDSGTVFVQSSNLFDVASLTYNCVSYNYLPLDSELLGIDPIRLPSNGKVLAFSQADIIVIHQSEQLTVTVEAGETVDVGEVRLVKLEATGSTYTADLDAGTITFDSAGEMVIDYRFEDMLLVTDVDISGLLTLSRGISHNYTAGKAKVASVLIAGDLWAHYNNLFDQQTWTNVWKDELIGNEVNAEYNDVDYPIVLTNDGAITEQWLIQFTSSTSFKLIGKNVGQIATGDINTDFAPWNPNTGKPYFTLNKLGWGTGWSTGNCLRFNSLGAVFQLNVIRTILQGESTISADTDHFALQIRGNINKEII